MGTVLGLADARDITHECMRVRDVALAGTWLYPAALQVPGTQHILDTILKDGLDSVTWWRAGEQAAKAVCQWVHPRPRREWLQSRLCHVDATVGESLRTVCDRFTVAVEDAVERRARLVVHEGGINHCHVRSARFGFGLA